MSTSGGGYIVYPIQRAPEELLDAAYSDIKDKSPQWEENPNNLDVWILQVAASQASDLTNLSRDVPDSIFMYYGSSIRGYPPNTATPANVDSTWTMKDNLGYTVPAGTQVSIRDDSGIEHGFIVPSDVIVPAGQIATPAGSVMLFSVEAGKALTGLGGPGYDADLIDTLNFVASVELTEFTSGGQDDELVSEYLTRLARKMQRLSQRPVLASDFSLAALDVPGVYRTLALDGYNSANGTFNNERYIGIAGVDELGQPISAPVKADLQATLDAQREINFVVNVFDPTITSIDVDFNVKALNGYTTTTVQSEVTSRIRAYLASSAWGRDPSYSDATLAQQTWVQTNVVIYNKILQVLASTTGVNYVNDARIAIHNAALGRVDVNLPGAAALTTPGTISGVAVP
jgi:uncharacterized phage protein gp47/JayE